MPDLIQPISQPPTEGGQPNIPAAYPAQVTIATPTGTNTDQPKDPAVELIRHKIDALYAEEPNAAEEMAEIKLAPRPGSSHQQFMAELSSSGKSLAEIQSAWHNYYINLPDTEKYKVWQEFYVANGANPAYQQFAEPSNQLHPIRAKTIAAPAMARSANPTGRAEALNRHAKITNAHINKTAQKLKESATYENAADIKKRILQTVKTVSSVSGGGKLQPKHHLKSLAFGLATGLVAVFIVLFGFFNEMIIAPFVQPSRHISDTPVIVDAASTIVSGGPKIIIPKINVEIPTDYSQTTTDEKQIELALDKGIVHYPTTVRPGQTGNAAFFGHSSNNIFNPGKYKFAFVLLHELVEGDNFYLTNDGTTYVYRVFSKRIVKPSEVSVLGPVTGKSSTATLITCDPPGTSLNRLVVVGEQISPDPGGNRQPGTSPTTPTPIVATTEQSGLPGNGPTLWSRIWRTIF